MNANATWTASRRAAILVALAVSLLLGSNATAMTVLKAPLSALVETSTLVLHGTVAKVEVLDLRRNNRGIWTEYTLTVKETLKGDARKVGKRFVWRLLGGTGKDGMTFNVPGMPTFVQGEETVVLFEKHSTGYTLTGAPQGKYHVFRDAKGQQLVKRDLEIAHLVRKDAQGRLVAADAPVAHGHRQLVSTPASDNSVTGQQTLASLRSEILGYVKAQRLVKTQRLSVTGGETVKSNKRAVSKPRAPRTKR